MLSIQEIDSIQIDYNMTSFDEQCLVDKFNQIYSGTFTEYNFQVYLFRLRQLLGNNRVERLEQFNNRIKALAKKSLQSGERPVNFSLHEYTKATDIRQGWLYDKHIRKPQQKMLSLYCNMVTRATGKNCEFHAQTEYKSKDIQIPYKNGTYLRHTIPRIEMPNNKIIIFHGRGSRLELFYRALYCIENSTSFITPGVKLEVLNQMFFLNYKVLYVIEKKLRISNRNISDEQLLNMLTYTDIKTVEIVEQALGLR